MVDTGVRMGQGVIRSGGRRNGWLVGWLVGDCSKWRAHIDIVECIFIGMSQFLRDYICWRLLVNIS